MTQPGEITLWRAPTKRCLDPLGEVQNGFDPADYPGKGLYFAANKAIAEGFQYHYQNGLQEFFIPQVEFQRLLQQNVILPDELFPAGEAWHVPPSGLVEFSRAMKQGSPGRYYPEP
jgi:hypothetical protein